MSPCKNRFGPLLGAGAAAAAYSLLVEPRWFRLRQVTVPVLRPAARRPLRLLHLSDLHLLPSQQHKHDFVRSCLRSAPDMIVVTGDILGDAQAIDSAVRLLAHARGDRAGVAVLGSHDLYASVPGNPLSYLWGPSGDPKGRRICTDRLVAGLSDAGWQLVDNRRLALDTPSGRVDLAGLGDAHVSRDHPELVDWTPPTEEPALRLAVTHAPYQRVLDVFDRHGFDLALAGHTHGGQLRVPFVGALVDNCDLPLRQARGLSRHGADLWLHVSAGMGSSRYAPMRFACRPEATILDLVAT